MRYFILIVALLATSKFAPMVQMDRQGAQTVPAVPPVLTEVLPSAAAAPQAPAVADAPRDIHPEIFAAVTPAPEAPVAPAPSRDFHPEVVARAAAAPEAPALPDAAPQAMPGRIASALPALPAPAQVSRTAAPQIADLSQPSAAWVGTGVRLPRLTGAPRPDAASVLRLTAPDPLPARPTAAQQLALSSMATAAEQDQAIPVEELRIVTAGVLNMRAGPSSRFPVVGQLVRGERTRILDQSRRGWVQVRVAGEGGSAQGWVFGRYLSPADGA